MDMTDKKRRIITLICAFSIPLLTGGFSALLTAEDMDIYESFNRPALAPPGWIFPIVWTVLYAMMGLASYYVFISDAGKEKKRKALTVYAIQLAMNMFWSTLFFTYQRFLISLIWLLVMWGAILVCTVRFGRIRKQAGLMMGGLLLWTTFAAYLNISYYVMSIKPMPLN